MPARPQVLLVGGTGRTGSRVLEQLLARGAKVRAIVRSASRLPESVRAHPDLTVVEATLLEEPDNDLVAQVAGSDVVISCLGHNADLAGVFGPPHNLVTHAVRRLTEAIRASRPASPVRLILMSSVSVNRPDAVERQRGPLEHSLLGVLRALVPPARDNQRAADYLWREVGKDDPHVRWVIVRPDALVEGDVSGFALQESLVSSLFRPDSTNMANVACFMCDLAMDTEAWTAWAGKLPVIVNAPSEGDATGA